MWRGGAPSRLLTLGLQSATIPNCRSWRGQVGWGCPLHTFPLEIGIQPTASDSPRIFLREPCSGHPGYIHVVQGFHLTQHVDRRIFSLHLAQYLRKSLLNGRGAVTLFGCIRLKRHMLLHFESSDKWTWSDHALRQKARLCLRGLADNGSGGQDRARFHKYSGAPPAQKVLEMHRIFESAAAGDDIDTLGLMGCGWAWVFLTPLQLHQF